MTPRREALYRLSASKLVMLEDRRGFRVAPVSPRYGFDGICSVSGASRNQSTRRPIDT